MDTTTRQLLSSALQDLARGLKKLRCVVDTQSAVTKCTQIPVSGDKNSPNGDKNSPSEIKSEIKPEFCISNGTKIPEENVECCVTLGHTPADWLFHEKNPWNSFHATCSFLYGTTLRGDRFKNQWLEDTSCLKGWRKISTKHLHEFYMEAYRYHDDCASMVQFAPNKEDFESDWSSIIPDEKWDRRNMLWDGDSNEKCFRKWLIAVHSDLPALNLPSVR